MKLTDIGTYDGMKRDRGKKTNVKVDIRLSGPRIVEEQDGEYTEYVELETEVRYPGKENQVFEVELPAFAAERLSDELAEVVNEILSES